MTKDTETAARYIKAEHSLEDLREIARGCTACDLHAKATQTVFGEGPAKAAMMLIGEQPGDAEDIAGHPFVGPAGRLLDKALVDAGIEREKVYVTNVVKHYRFVMRGKKRLHQKPKIVHVDACLPWLEAEIARVGPEVIVALGATAAQAMFGSAFRVTQERGREVPSGFAAHAFATIHPSSILRASSREGRAQEFGRFVSDLRTAASSAQANR